MNEPPGSRPAAAPAPVIFLHDRQKRPPRLPAPGPPSRPPSPALQAALCRHSSSLLLWPQPPGDLTPEACPPHPHSSQWPRRLLPGPPVCGLGSRPPRVQPRPLPFVSGGSPSSLSAASQAQAPPPGLCPACSLRGVARGTVTHIRAGGPVATRDFGGVVWSLVQNQGRFQGSPSHRGQEHPLLGLRVGSRG